MAEHHENHDEHGEHQHIGIPGYLVVFGILVVGTIATYLVALRDLDGLLFSGANTLVALMIAFFKMTCVVLYFMHVRWQTKMIWLTALAGFFWMAIMFAFTIQDYATRPSGLFTN